MSEMYNSQDIKETLECLNVSFSSSNNFEKKKALEKLETLSKNLLHHIRIVYLTLKDETLLKNDNLKLSIIIYIKTLINKEINQKTFSDIFLKELLQDLIDLLISQSFTDNFLKNTIPLISSIINYFANHNDFVYYFINMLDEFFAKVHNSDLKVKPLISIYCCIFQSKLINADIDPFPVFEKLFSSINSVLQKIISNFQGINMDNQFQLFLLYNDLCSSIFEGLHSACVRAKRLGVDDKLVPLHEKYFVQTAVLLINSTVPNIWPNYIIFWTNNPELNLKLNLMKSRCFNYLRDVIKIFKVKITNESIIKTISSVVDVCIINLDFLLNEKYEYISNMSKDNPNYPDYNYEMFIYSKLNFLSKFLTREPIISFFSVYAKKFIFSVIFPLLAGTEKELVEIRTNGSEYNEFIADIIDDKKHKQIKTISAYILDKFCLKYDGIGNYVMSLCIQILNFIFSRDDLNSLNKYPLLDQPYAERIIKMKQENQIEVCLLIFTVMTHLMTKSERHLEGIKVFFNNYYNDILKYDSVFVKSRLCAFFGFFLDELFNDNKDLINKSIEFLFINLFKYNQFQGLSYQVYKQIIKAADAISDLISINQYKGNFQEIVKFFLDQIIENITEIEIPFYFDLIHEILECFIEENNMNVIKICEKCRNRILKEIKKPSKIVSESDSNTFISKCFNIIKLLTDKDKNIANKIDKLEEILEPIFEYMKNPSKIDFEEEIISIISSLVKISKSVTPSTQKVFVYLDKYFEQNNVISDELYELLSYIILYGTDFLLKDPSHLNFYLYIFRNCIKDFNYFDNTLIYATTLVQNLLQINNFLPFELVKQFIQDSLHHVYLLFEEYKQDSNKLNNYIEFYKFINLLSILFSGFIHHPLLTYSIFKEENRLELLINSTKLILSNQAFSSFHSKIFVTGICGLITSNQLFEEVKDQLFSLLSLIILILYRQRNEESKTLKVSLKKELDCNFVDSDKEDEDGMDNLDYEEDINNNFKDDVKPELFWKVSAKYSPFKDSDEYNIFKFSIEKLKTLSPNFLNDWFQSLKPAEKEVLDNILKLKRISVETSNIIHSVPRKILKIKRNNNA